MKKFFLLFLFSALSQIALCQAHLEWLSEESRNLILKGRECREKQEQNCLDYFKEGYKQSLKDKKCIPCAELQLAMHYYKMAEADSAYFHLNKLLKSSEKLQASQRDEIQLVAYNQKGVIESQSGNVAESVRSFIKSADLAEKLGKEEQAAAVKFNVGVIYFNQSNYEQANKLIKEAYRKFKKLKAGQYYSVSTGNIAGAYFGMEEIDSAIIWARKSIQYSKQFQDIKYLNYGYYVLANSYFAKNNLDSSYFYADLGVKNARENDDLEGLANNLQILAQNQIKNKDFKNALRNYEEALSITENQLNILTKRNVVYKDLGTVYLKVGDYKNSAVYYEKFVSLNDSIASEEKQKLVHELNTKYETEKKEKQIAGQELKIQKQRSNLLYTILGGGLLISVLGGIFFYNRKTQKLKLKQLQQEKENAILNSFIQGEERERSRISHELHDSVAAMIGAAKMSLETIPHLPPEKQTEHLEKVVSILENTHADVRHIAHNLLPTVLEKEGIIKATEHFAAEVNETKLLNISVLNENSKADELSLQLQLMLFRVIQELVNNIIKHSQAQNAVIAFSRNSSGIQIEVSDDGIGYEGGIDSGSQGLYSISQRLKSIGGNFKFVKKKDKGMQAIAELKV